MAKRNMCKKNHVLCTCCVARGELEVEAVGRRRRSVKDPEWPNEVCRHATSLQVQDAEDEQTFFDALPSRTQSETSSIYSQSSGGETEDTAYSTVSVVVKHVECELGQGKDVSFLWLDGEDEVEEEGVVNDNARPSGRRETWWEEVEEDWGWDNKGSVVSIATPLSPSRARVVDIPARE